MAEQQPGQDLANHRRLAEAHDNHPKPAAQRQNDDD